MRTTISLDVELVTELLKFTNLMMRQGFYIVTVFLEKFSTCLKR